MTEAPALNWVFGASRKSILSRERKRAVVQRRGTATSAATESFFTTTRQTRRSG